MSSCGPLNGELSYISDLPTVGDKIFKGHHLENHLEFRKESHFQKRVRRFVQMRMDFSSIQADARLLFASISSNQFHEFTFPLAVANFIAKYIYIIVHIIVECQSCPNQLLGNNGWTANGTQLLQANWTFPTSTDHLSACPTSTDPQKSAG